MITRLWAVRLIVFNSAEGRIVQDCIEFVTSEFSNPKGLNSPVALFSYNIWHVNTFIAFN